MKKEIVTAPAAVIEIDFRKKLEDLFEDCFVIQDYDYKGIVMDHAIITTDRFIEVRHVRTKQEYAAELATIGRAGRITFDKHKSIQGGTFISNAFYFMCPSRILTATELPPKYGLITYNQEEELELKKEADWINPKLYISKSAYATMARKLAKKLYSK